MGVHDLRGMPEEGQERPRELAKGNYDGRGRRDIVAALLAKSKAQPVSPPARPWRARIYHLLFGE